MKKDIQRLADAVPKIIKIAGYPWSVSLQKDWLIGPDNKNKWGFCSPSNLALSIGNLNGMPAKEYFVGILLHEVFHAVWSLSNLRPKETEENVALAFEVGLIQVFKDNPDFLNWVKKGLK